MSGSTRGLYRSENAGMSSENYGEGYRYAHDTEEKLTRMECLPESMRGSRYYYPTEQGAEAKVKERLEEIMEWKHL